MNLIEFCNVLAENLEPRQKDMSEQRFKKTPIVIVPHGVTTRLAKHFGVTIQAIRNALKYQCNSEQAQTIRREAVQNYGGTETQIRVKA